MRSGLAAFLVAAVLPLTACGGGSDGGASVDADWSGPPQPDERGALDVGAYNEYLGENGAYAAAPVVAATRFLRLDSATAGTTAIVARSSAEGQGPTTVTVTLDRLLDDSVRAQRFVLVLAREDDGEWRLTSATAQQRCWPNRGHQAFSPEPCL